MTSTVDRRKVRNLKVGLASPCFFMDRRPVPDHGGGGDRDHRSLHLLVRQKKIGVNTTTT